MAKSASIRFFVVGINVIMIIGTLVLFLLGIPQAIIQNHPISSSTGSSLVTSSSRTTVSSSSSRRQLQTIRRRSQQEDRELIWDDNGFKIVDDYVFYDDYYNDDDGYDDGDYRFVEDDDAKADDDYSTDDQSLYITPPKLIDCSKMSQTTTPPPKVRIGYLGNSFIFYNDCPLILQEMLEESGVANGADTCLQGGSPLLDLFDNGCALIKGEFLPPPSTYELDGKCYTQNVKQVKAFLHQYDYKPSDGYDYVIMNDQSQYPARISTRADTMWSLKKQYGAVWPTNTKTGKPAIPIFLQTPAYRSRGNSVTLDLGNFDNFTQSVKDGYTQYQEVMNDKVFTDGKTKALIAPVGDAYQILRNTNEPLWEKLYHSDNYHPSIYGTYLQAVILHMMITQEMPPAFDQSWWDNARSITTPIAFPTTAEAQQLVQTAAAVVGLSKSAMKGTTNDSNAIKIKDSNRNNDIEENDINTITKPNKKNKNKNNNDRKI